MSAAGTLLPTTVALSAESAINNILSDIPLFCEGIMGIGVFTFLFVTKQAKLLSIFLYASSFLVFAAATLDLSQVIIRGPQNSSKITISLGSISGFIYAREVFLSLSILFLDLFFWHLISRCPRREHVTRSNELATNRASRLPSMHSASWNRWGMLGTILKYGSLAALLSVPLLSMLWRLMPTQRKYGSVYVVEATTQTTIMAIFILKLLLNVSISPLDKSWHALQEYTVPIASLMIGLALGISNIVIFAFTETILGRLLLAVQVYLLMVHNLFTTFRDARMLVGVRNSPQASSAPAEKSNYIDILPLSYTDKRNASPSSLYPRAPSRLIGSNNRRSLLSWILPPHWALTPSETRFPRREDEVVLAATEATSIASRSERTDFLNMSSPKLEGSMNKSVAENSQDNIERPFTTMSASYYAMDYEPSGMSENRNISQVVNSRHSSVALFEGESQRGITNLNSRPSSLDEILRQQNELDKSIAALRLVSVSMPSDTPFEVSSFPTAAPTTTSKSSTTGQSRNTLISRKTESSSNRSDFSLSVFPDPPAIPNTETTLSDQFDGHQGDKSSKGKEKTRRLTSLTIDVEELQSPNEVSIDPPAVQYDVTSFIGDLSEPPRSSQVISLPENLNSDEDTPTISVAQVRPASGLRPMILASMVLAAPSSPRTNPIKYDFEERMSSNSISEAALPLRPLLLGNPSAQVISQRMALTKIPLAQRRQRGGTISSSTRRPVISSPKLTQDRNEVVSGAFERPRPPPLRLNEVSKVL